MKTNKYLLLLAVLMLVILPLTAQQNADKAATITNHYATRNFAAGTIPAADLEIIVQAGIRAPSARNLQPWHFTVVQNPVLTKKIIAGCDEGNVLIIVSAQSDTKANNADVLDCALAVQSIYLAAQALGYGSRIYTGPVDNFNKNLKAEITLPKGHSAVAIVRVGKIKEPAPDAVSAASRRKSASEVVTYK